VQIVVQ